MRGKGLDNAGDTTWLGITPAYAGKSSLIIVQVFGKWDHPRVCGEKTSYCCTFIVW